MAIKQYSVASEGETLLSPNFRVREFACRDGSDSIPISEELVALLQQLRDRLGVPIHITSGYRSPEYNRRVGGAVASQHLLGKAADITCAVDPLVVAYRAQELGFPGVECGTGSDYVHVDVREGKWRAIKPYADRSYETVAELFPTVYYGSRGQAVNLLERYLKALGYYTGTLDEHCGPLLRGAIQAFQADNGLTADGIMGPLSWGKLVENSTQQAAGTSSAR